MLSLEFFPQRTKTDDALPGRSAEARGPSDSELKATAVIALPIEEASAKVRSGPPGPSKKDTDPSIWAGVIPLELTAREPVADELTDLVVSPPDYAHAGVLSVTPRNRTRGG